MAKNKFEILKERISYAEAGGTGNMDANILKSNSSQHYGYQQIDKTRIKLFSEYLIFLFKDNNTLLNIVTEFYTSFMEATSTDRAQGTQTWTRIFTEHWQDLLHTLYTYDKIKQKPSLHHLDQVILNNLLGQWQAFESIQELHTPVYSDKDFTYFNYLGHSMPDISDREKMHVPHPDSPTSSIFLDPCTRETLLLDLEAHVKDTLWPLLFDNEEYVPLFDIHKYESFKRTSTVPTEAGTEESVKSLNPNFYKWGRGAEEQGALYIGDILFSVPPVSLRFSTTNQSLVIPTMRTKGDPIMTSNGELSRIDTTLYFTGVDAINNQLRPLNALFQNMPFTTVQNTTIYDSWISRKVIQQDLKPDTDARSRFFPIPIYLENISVTTVPGFPNTMQAHVSFVKFNNLPYGAALKYYKHNDDAIANAKKKSTIGALDSKIIKSDATDKETTLTVLKSNSTVETFSGSNTLNKTDAYNEDVYTFYPQESTPFQNQYKYAFKKGVKDYWPKYVDKDNETLYLTYKAPKTMMSASYAFKSRLDTINRKNSLIKSTLNNINSMSNDAIKELYSVQEFDFKGLLSSLLNSVSFVREYKETKNAFNRAFYDWISELQDNNAFGPYSIDSATLQEAFGVDNVSEILELKSENFVDKDLNITSVGEKLIEFVTVTMVNVIADSSASPEDKQRDLDALFSPLIDQLNLHADNPSGILDTDVTNTPLNYEKVTIGLGIFGEGENEYQDGRIALETLYSENVHSNTPYAFQSVVQSISYSYANTVIPIQMASASSPTYQHMGVSNPTVSITLRTRDEGLNKLITDMRIATQEIGRSVAMGSTSLIGLDSIEIQGSTSTSDKGHLLNALGFSSASIKNIHSKSLESYPGWWEITIDLVSNKQKIRILEKLNAVSTDALDIIPALTQHLFPLYKVNMFPVLSKISNATIANLSNEIGRVGVSKVRLHGEIFLENLLPLEERISNLLKGDITENYFVGVDFNCFIDDQLAVHIVMPGRANIVSNYWEILANLISFIEDTLNDVTRWEQERRLESDSWNEIHPINISLSATLRSHYEDVLNSVIATISFIAKNNPKELEKVGSTQAFYPLLGMPTDLSSPNILLELIILSNQLKTSAYGLIKRADFREYMSELEFSQKLDADSLIEIIKSNLTEVEDWSTSVFRDELYKNIALFYKKVHKYRSSLSPETPDITESFNTLFEAIGKNISPNYPDLSLGNDIIEDIGVRYKSPSFPFVDQDLNAEVIQMERLTTTTKLIMFSQFAGVASGRFQESLAGLKEILGTGEQEVLMNVMLNSIVDSKLITEKELTALSGLPLVGTTGQYKIDWGAGFDVYKSIEAKAQRAGPDGLTGPSKVDLMQIMANTAMMDYLVAVMYTMSLSEVINNSIGSTTEESKNALLKKLYDQEWSYEGYAKTISEALTLTTNPKLTAANKSNEMGASLAAALLQKRQMAVNMATMVTDDNPDAFLQYFGIGSVDSEKEHLELLDKVNDYVQHKRTGGMDRAFPTFKILFIEEDDYTWKAFDDFYTYDAASEISIVESKHAASKTAVLRLSNVTNNLTNEVLANLTNESDVGATNSHQLSLRVGTQLMILVGYGADYRHLRMKFKGAITEIVPGQVLEVTAQSWGAGLLNAVGATGTEALEYSATSGATSLGAAVVDILAQTPGLKHLGRWEARDANLNDPSKVSETTLKNMYWAKSIAHLAGAFEDFSPIKTNIVNTVKGLPSSFMQLQEANRYNNVITKSFGNSLYDNIIINDTDPSGYGFFNLVSRTAEWLWETVSFSDAKSFKWVVLQQNAWDALHEVTLFLGDYIVTTLPFNEGKDFLTQAPRETLYFGPRDGKYRAASYSPRYDVKDIIKQILKDAGPVWGPFVEGRSPKVTETMIPLGKTMLASLLAKAANLGTYDRKEFMGFFSDAVERKAEFFQKDNKLLSVFIKNLQQGGFENVATLIKDTVHPGFTSGESNLITPLHNEMPFSVVHQILLNDFENKYLDDANKIGAYNYYGDDAIVVTHLRSVTGIADPSEFQLNSEPLRDDGWGQSEFEKLHRHKEQSAFNWIFFDLPHDSSYSPLYENYFKEFDDALTRDMLLFLNNYADGLDNPSVINNIAMMKDDLENAIASTRGDLATFLYKPVVSHHIVTSYEDIIDNGIIATADQMYNHVEVLFGDSVDPSNSAANATHRAQAWISYDQDPDFLRSYQVYMKNLNPNVFFDFIDARNTIQAAKTPAAQRNASLTQHAIAQQVLMNVMKPMYQGTITIMGNPNIKPWDIVHIHDDSIAMYGPIEVEQVVNTISVTGGYTTTIIPNLYVNYKDATRAISDLLIDMNSSVRVASLFGHLFKLGALVGSQWLLLKPPLNPWKGQAGGFIGNYFKKKAAGQAEIKALEKLDPWKDLKKIKAGAQDAIDDDVFAAKKTIRNRRIIFSRSILEQFTEVAPDLQKIKRGTPSYSASSTVDATYLDESLVKAKKAVRTSYSNIVNILEREGAQVHVNEFKSLQSKIGKAESFADFEKIQKNLVKMRRKVGKEIVGEFDDIVLKRLGGLTTTSSLMKVGAKAIPFIGWALTIYDVLSAAWDISHLYASRRVFMAGLLSGENQLVWVPLEYQGKPYTAGLEGIIGTPRSIETVLLGELNGDNISANRSITIMKRMLDSEAE